MSIKLSVVSNLMFLFYKYMACAVYLRVIISKVIFHIVCISHYKSIKLIDDTFYKKIINAKSNQNCKLSTYYTTKDKWVWHYYNNNYYRMKDGFNIFTSQTERRIVSTTVAQVITVIAVEIWRRYNFDMISWRHMNAVSMSYRHRMLLKILLTKLLWKLKILSASHNNEAFIQ